MAQAQSKRTTTRKKTTKKKVAKKGGESGIRIHELSRELKQPKSAVLEVAASQRIPATSHLSMVTEEQAQKIRDAFGGTSRAPKPKKASKKQAGKKARKGPPATATAKATTATTTAGGKRKASTRVVVTQDLGRGKVGNPRLKTMCMQFLEGCGC